MGTEMEMLILSMLLLFVPLYIYVSRMSSNSNAAKTEAVVDHLQLPPGSSGWPIIGEGLAFLMTAKRGVPEKFIADRRIKYSSSQSASDSCKVFTTSLLRESVAVLCTAGGNKFMFSNENKLVHSWWPENIYTIFAGSTDRTPTRSQFDFAKFCLNSSALIVSTSM